MAGRPRIELTDEQVVEVEKLAAYLSLDQIADFLGIGASTLDRRLADDERVRKAYDRGRAKAIKEVAKGLLRQALEGNLNAQTFYLRTQAGWKETQRTEHTGADGGPVELTQVSDEELRARRDRLLDRLKS